MSLPVNWFRVLINFIFTLDITKTYSIHYLISVKKIYLVTYSLFNVYVELINVLNFIQILFKTTIQ